MRAAPRQPLSAADLAAQRIHVVVRDYPETLAVFRSFDVDVPTRGGESLAGVLPDVGPLLDAIERSVRWRTRT